MSATERHPTKRLTAPDGIRADIDVLLVPVIKALWAAGYETIGSCQDIGESAGRTYQCGYALLEMPIDDACNLLDNIKHTRQFKDRMHWASDGAWSVTIPVLAFGIFGEDDRAVPGPWAQIRFPNDQIGDLVEVLTPWQ